MRIGVFTYNFPHEKTQQGLLGMVAAGLKPDIVVCQPKKKLPFEPSKIRTLPRTRSIIEPITFMNMLGMDYLIADHDSPETISVLKSLNLDIGVILGARILRRETITAFKHGILNIHPGILPENRGLDCIKWAIHEKFPQGLTLHFIDSRVDCGWEVEQNVVEIYSDDTMIDISYRLQDSGLVLLLSNLLKFKSGGIPKMEDLVALEPGENRGIMPFDIEKNFGVEFCEYRDKYAKTFHQDS